MCVLKFKVKNYKIARRWKDGCQYYNWDMAVCGKMTKMTKFIEVR